MNEIKEIAKINLKYNDYSEPKFLFINTYDNSLYVGDETKAEIYTVYLNLRTLF